MKDLYVFERKKTRLRDGICCVYKITCKPTGEAYIGVTNAPTPRWNAHVSTSQSTAQTNRLYNSPLSIALRKYGKGSFEREILLYGSREYCLEMEIKCITLYKTMETGFNQSIGGEGGDGYVHPRKGRSMPKIDCYKLSPQDKSRFLEESRRGIHYSKMEWLPISPRWACQILNDNNIPIPGKIFVIPKELRDRLIEEIKSGKDLGEISWWTYGTSAATRALRKAGIYISKSTK